MKNQLRKATLRAAALTMSATIAATSVPMTAFAEEGNGDDAVKAKPAQEEQKAADADEKAVINQEANKTAPAVEEADSKVDKIAPAENIKNDKVEVGEIEKTVENAVNDAKEATEGAKTEESNVATDIKDLGTIATAVDSEESTLSSDITKANEAVSADNKTQNDANDEIAKLQETVDNAQYKEDAQVAADDAKTIADAADKAYNKAKENYETTINNLNSALGELKTQQKAYNDAITAGLTDLADVETKLAAAQANVDALQTQVTNVQDEIAKSASVLLANKYFAENKSADDKKALVEDILNSYYLKEVAPNAENAKVESYDAATGLYKVNYSEGRSSVTVYVAVENNKDDNGISLTLKEREDIEAHYTTDAGKNLPLSVYEDNKNGVTLIEQNGEKYIFNKNDVVVDITAGTVGNTETKIEDTKPFIDENGIVKTTGKVTTVTKTANSLVVEKSTDTFTDEASARAAAIDYINSISKDGVTYEYTDDDIEIIPNPEQLAWSATANYVVTKKQTVTSDNINYGNNLTQGTIFDGNKYLLNTPEVEVKTETVKEHVKIRNFWGRVIDEYDVDKEITYYSWDIEYADVTKDEESYSVVLAGLKLGKSKQDVIKEVTEKIESTGGFVVGFKWFDGIFGGAEVKSVKGTGSVTVTGTSETDAKGKMEEALRNNNAYLPTAKISDYTSNVVEKASYSYKINGATKVETKVDDNVTISHTNEKATKLTYVGATTNYNKLDEFNLANNEAFKAQNEADTAKKNAYDNLDKQLTAAEDALIVAERERASLETNIKALQTAAGIVNTDIATLESNIANIKFDPNGTYKTEREKIAKEIKDKFDKLPNRPSNNGGSNNGGSSSNNNNNNNNQPAAPVLPVGPAATTTTTTQQVVTLVDDQTPLSATADDTVAPKTNKKAAKKNAAKTTDSDSKKTNKNNTKKQPKKVTPEVEDDTIDEDLEIVSLDDEDKVPLAPGVASNDSTKDIMDETASVSWLWLIILVVASVVTFGTYKGVKKHNENKGKNNR